MVYSWPGPVGDLQLVWATSRYANEAPVVDSFDIAAADGGKVAFVRTKTGGNGYPGAGYRVRIPIYVHRSDR